MSLTQHPLSRSKINARERHDVAHAARRMRLQVGQDVKKLVSDFKQVMEPFTASKLKVIHAPPALVWEWCVRQSHRDAPFSGATQQRSQGFCDGGRSIGHHPHG